jgi:hypothetical protein
MFGRGAGYLEAKASREWGCRGGHQLVLELAFFPTSESREVNLKRDSPERGAKWREKKGRGGGKQQTELSR